MTQYSGIYTLQSQGQALTSGQWATDPYYKNTTLLLHADGVAGGAQNNTFLDSSTNAFTITRNGNTTQGSFTPYGPDWSNYFNGSSDYLSVASDAVFAFGTSDFTLEFWAFTTASGRQDWLDLNNGTSANRIQFIYDGTNLSFYNNGSLVAGGTYTLPLNTWTHYALVRSSGTAKVYANGVQVGSSGSSTTNFSANPVRIAHDDSTHWATGYMSNVRITKNGALYSSTFSPSTVPLTTTVSAGTVSLLTCQSNRFVDNSASPLTITVNSAPSVQRFSPFPPQYQYTPAVIGGSGYFDGTGDYLSVANNSALQIATGDFTLELWLWVVESAGANQVFLSKWNGSNGYLMFVNTSRQINFQSTATSLMTSSSTIQYGQWNHIAVVRNGNVYTLYVNGASAATTTTASTNTDGGNAFELGRNTDGGINYFKGYMSDVRLTKSGALYTTTFTPPTTPLTTTVASGTVSLLTSMTNAGIYDNAMMNNLETVGDAQVSTSVVKYGSGSLKFDGTGDQLNIASNQSTVLGAGDFTVEYWVYSTSFYNYITHVSSTRGANGFNCGTQVAAQLVWYANGAERVRGNIVMAANTWYHVAFVRSGGVLKGYLNGVQDGTTYTDPINYSTPIIVIGNLNTGGESMTGYIDDLRITKGVARYTSNFIPPKVAFANQ